MKDAFNPSSIEERLRSLPVPWIEIKLVGEDGQLLADLLQFSLRNRSPHKTNGLANPRNSLAMVALVEAFLQQHIGGRAEPFGDALKQSSMEWRLRSLPTP